MKTRFAPSPTGPLHLGHAYSAILAHDMALAEGGAFLLRIEDIDRSRARPEWEELIREDLRWLGLDWEEPVIRQSERTNAYDAVLKRLGGERLLYLCACNRRDVLAAASAPNEGTPVSGPDGVVYPGTCRSSANKTAWAGWYTQPTMSLRLDMAQAMSKARGLLSGGAVPGFVETGNGPAGEQGAIEVGEAEAMRGIGDVVLARRDMGTSYHLSVVVDDAAQGITHVVRGQDLFEATKIHAVLQAVLGLPTPLYHHHRLIRDETGKRLAKRDDARAIRTYRDEGASPAEIRRMVGL